MTGPADWNAKVIAEFRERGGRVGGAFEGAPITLVHHRGRRSGRDYVTPMMYLPDEQDAKTIYVFASKAGAATHPDWYFNLVAAGEAEVEVGTETYAVTVSELLGAERERIYAEQARRYPGFAEYADKTAGSGPSRCWRCGVASLARRRTGRRRRSADATAPCSLSNSAGRHPAPDTR